jgi:plasmid stability protein
MADLNIRGVSDELVAALKVDAAARRRTLKEHCIALLSAAPREQAEAPKAIAQTTAREWIGCQTCGGVNGLHQRGCTRKG